MTNKKLLQEIIAEGIIEPTQMQVEYEMRKENIIKNYPYSIWQGKNGKWYTKRKNENGQSRLVKRNTEAEIKEFIFASYKQKSDKATLTTLFTDWLKYKALETSLANANKLKWAWNKYYADEPIANTDITDIKVIDLKTWFLNMIDKYSLNTKQYKELKSVANMMFDYAIELELLEINRARNVSRIPAKKFTEVKTTLEEQVYTPDEERLLLETALDLYNKSNNVAYLAVCLDVYLGLRVGELVALCVEDFKNGILSIQRQHVRDYHMDENGNIYRKGFSVSDNLKTKESRRDLVLTDGAQIFFDKIMEHNQKNNIESSFLLIGEYGDRLHDNAINYALEKINAIIDTPQKGCHSLRKTYLSILKASGQLSDEEIRKIAGHKFISTTQNNYFYDVSEETEKRSRLEKALKTVVLVS